jgi:hypothetical protein
MRRTFLGVAQLVECGVRDLEAAGANPVTQTNNVRPSIHKDEWQRRSRRCVRSARRTFPSTDFTASAEMVIRPTARTVVDSGTQRSIARKTSASGEASRVALEDERRATLQRLWWFISSSSDAVGSPGGLGKEGERRDHAATRFATPFSRGTRKMRVGLCELPCSQVVQSRATEVRKSQIVFACLFGRLILLGDSGRRVV